MAEQKKISNTRQWFKNNYGASDEQLDSMFNQIGQVESNNEDIVQEGGGPGRGYFQFETKEGSGAFQTALTRYENLNRREHGEEWESPDWLVKARESDNAMDLSREQQEDLLLADLAMKSGSDELIKDSLETGSAKDLWLQKHWAGADIGTEEYKAKGAQWDANAPAFMEWSDPEEEVLMDKWTSEDNLIKEDR